MRISKLYTYIAIFTLLIVLFTFQLFLSLKYHLQVALLIYLLTDVRYKKVYCSTRILILVSSLHVKVHSKSEQAR